MGISFFRKFKYKRYVPIVKKREFVKAFIPEHFVTTSAGLDVYIIDAENAPAAMTEIGRIRELEFRSEGGGTGKDLDIDIYDLTSPRYRQLVAWDPEAEEIVAMYRFIRGAKVDPEKYQTQLSSAELFEFSPQFLTDYLPYTIELGRSVVNRSARHRHKGLFAVWSGLGALVREYSDTRYFFGKFTVFPSFNMHIRKVMYATLRYWCQDHSGLLNPRPHCQVSYDQANWKQGNSFRDDLNKLVKIAADYNSLVPPLVLSYARLTDQMKVFGTAINLHFGNVEETAILLPIEYIRPRIRHQFIDSYVSVNPRLFA